MAMLDLSLVTKALRKLLHDGITTSPAWGSPAPTLEVFPVPPDKLAGERTIGLYLYHVVETAHTKNTPPTGNGSVPIRYTPLGLELYYLLTPFSSLGSEIGPLVEQKMLGLAMKVLRDFSVLDDTTLLNGALLFSGELSELKGHDNRFRMVLQPVPPNEAVQYWTAGSQPMRLSAYYQVSVVLLEPEPITSRTGRVLTYNIQTFLRGSPRLDGSRNRITFTLPDEPSPREIVVQPAEVPIGEVVEFFGTELRDQNTTLILQSNKWNQPIEVNSTDWQVHATSESVKAKVFDSAGSQTILPGVYSAQVKVSTQRLMADHSLRRFEKISNATPFAIAPFIQSVSSFASNQATITGKNFDPAMLPGDAIQLYLGPNLLKRTAALVPGAGEFRVVDPSQIIFQLPSGLTTGDRHPLRLLVRGIESAPRWIEVP